MGISKRKKRKIKNRAIELYSKDTPFKPKIVETKISKQKRKRIKKVKDEDF